MKLRILVPALLAAFVLSASSTSAAPGREINASNVLKGPGPYIVLSENGVPNGMPCDWYAYATSVGQEYCDHPGVDINATYENLYAATDGVVEFAGSDAAYWPMHVDIRVTSERYLGELHIYGHMSQVFVATGQFVEKGDVLGISGEAGGAPHLHFERRTAPNAQCAIGCAIDPDAPLHGGQDIETEPAPEKAKDEKAKPKSDKAKTNEKKSDEPKNNETKSDKAKKNEKKSDEPSSDDKGKTEKKSKKEKKA